MKFALALPSVLLLSAPTQALRPQDNPKLAGGVKLAWEAQFAGISQARDEGLVVAVGGGRVYSAWLVENGSNAVRIAAHSSTSGELLWEQTWVSGALAAVHLDRMAYDPVDDRLFLTGGATFFAGPPCGAGQAPVLALDASDGGWLWESCVPSTFAPTPRNALAVAAGRLLVLTQTQVPGTAWDWHLSAHELSTGAVLWSSDFDAGAGASDFADQMLVSPFGSVAYSAGDVVGAGGSAAFVRAQSVFDGGVLWEGDLDPNGTTNFRAMARDDAGMRLFAVADGGLYALDAQTGGLLWNVGLPGSGREVAASSDGSRVVVAMRVAGDGGVGDSFDVRLQAFQAADGSLLWDVAPEGGSLDKDVVQHLSWDSALDRVLLGFQESGSLTTIALAGSDGSSLWQATQAHEQMDLILSTPVVHDAGAQPARLLALTQTSSVGTSSDVLLESRSVADGGLDWSTTMGAQTGSIDLPVDLLLATGQDRIYTLYTSGEFAGTSSANGAGSLVATDLQSGTALWERAFDSTQFGGMRLGAAAAHPNGETVFVAGAASEGDGWSYFSSGLNEGNGTFSWTQELLAPVDTTEVRTADAIVGENTGLLYTLRHVLRDPDGTPVSADVEDVLLSAQDAGTGALVWTALDPGLSGLRIEAVELAMAPDESRLYSFFARDNQERALVVQAHDPISGLLLWEQAYDPSVLGLTNWGGVRPGGLAVASGGEALYLCGDVRPIWSSNDREGVLVRLDSATGAVVWDRLWSGADAADDSLLDLAVDGAGATLYAAGYANGDPSSASSQALVVAFEAATGATRWERIEPAAAVSSYSSIALRPSGATLLVGGPSDVFLSSVVHQFEQVVAAYSTLDGALRWSATHLGPDGGARTPRALLAPEGGALIAGPVSSANLEGTDALLQHYVAPELAGAPSSISLSAGGAQLMSLEGGLTHAGLGYLLLGSASGTDPGLELEPGLVLPLQPDAYSALTLFAPNLPPLAGSVGALDGAGRASASFSLPPGSPSALIGLKLHHAYLVLGPFGFEQASQPLALELAP